MTVKKLIYLIARKFAKKVLPRQMQASLRNYRTLSFFYGQYRTIEKRESLGANGEPWPWYTYPAIDYLEQLDLSNKRVFEFGSGNSTLYWEKRCKSVAAVEDNGEWYSRIRGKLSGNTLYHYAANPGEYTSKIEESGECYDIIIVDGVYRRECAEVAHQWLAVDGFIILDNSDWHASSAQLLRDSGLIQVDFYGFGPINEYAWVTSIFFRREVSLRPRFERWPKCGRGGLPQTAE